tara:strand:- start:252 stop:509 length:258 start_codon:yes stop_codon:yes gene_type:complete
MIESLGWIVAALVAVGVLLMQIVRKGVPETVTAPIASRESEKVAEDRRRVVEATEADIKGLWKNLESDDPEGSIADASNRSRLDR